MHVNIHSRNIGSEVPVDQWPGAISLFTEESSEMQQYAYHDDHPLSSGHPETHCHHIKGADACSSSFSGFRIRHQQIASQDTAEYLDTEGGRLPWHVLHSLEADWTTPQALLLL